MYDPDERINRLADEVDRDAPLLRLTLFSPCKVLIISCYEFKKHIYWFLGFLID